MYKDFLLKLELKINDLEIKKNTLSSDDVELLTRLLKVKSLVSNSFDNIFELITIDTAYGILSDIGVEKNIIPIIYKKLMREIYDSKGYKLVDFNINNKF